MSTEVLPNQRTWSPLPSTRPRNLLRQGTPDRRLPSLGCWSTFATLIKPSWRCETSSPTLVGSTIGVSRSAFSTTNRSDGVVAQEMTPEGIIFQAHSVCRPRRLKKERDGALNEIDAALPRSTAAMYLDRRGEWNLPLFNGVASAPLLKDDGRIVCAEGYDLRIRDVVRERARSHSACSGATDKRRGWGGAPVDPRDF